MTLTHLLFGFRGRASRMPFSLGNLAVVVLLWVMAVTLLLAPSLPENMWMLLIPVVLLACWCSAALFVKRLHDRDRSGWWLLLYIATAFVEVPEKLYPEATMLNTALDLLAFAIAIWFLVDLGFLRGTEGPNHFGPDPLGNVAPVLRQASP